MCLINCSVGSFCEANEIRMILFLVFRGLLAVLSSPMARFRETADLREESFRRVTVWPTDANVRVARPLRISEGRMNFRRDQVYPERHGSMAA